MAKVLIVEDDTSIANLYKTELDLRGHKVQVMDNGTGVIEKIVEFSPDLILLDIQLPDKDGLTILKEIKADPKAKDVKVIVVSNYSDDKNVEAALDLGALDFIPKFRVVPEELGEKVEKSL
ncbi:hypothetical protein COV24_01700 [candidate division WWE3 bacterium CG10_big_fil_rev_8_21_14_0_10_32_10]|uniref:Response regulatory domain-containing protein n=1 Tax=candidate division WWE3 bacterium CG10_big_fil_rev_8_21_14_0_10_32_10 TaxID=1975090 RepID=A0A2H0RC56_UNCKA|nr:MAG: hypothetical protein COV24_01700 [candidate division WWE3 bacterium CG10_big_fil_rev_8_21_14_0_10_32_10]